MLKGYPLRAPGATLGYTGGMGQSDLRDLQRGISSSLFRCMEKMDSQEERVACAQGVANVNAFARRKFEGMFSNIDEVNKAYWAALRLCRRRFGAPGTRAMDACDLGAWHVLSRIRSKVPSAPLPPNLRGRLARARR